MKPYLLIFETQAQNGILARSLESTFKGCAMINPFTFIFPTLEQLSQKLKTISEQGSLSNPSFIITQVSESVSLRNCGSIQDVLKKAEVQVFPSL